VAHRLGEVLNLLGPRDVDRLPRRTAKLGSLEPSRRRLGMTVVSISRWMERRRLPAPLTATASAAWPAHRTNWTPGRRHHVDDSRPANRRASHPLFP